jgi:hypothetical protein
MNKPLGYVVYEGPSAIDGAPIVVILNKVHDESANDKTGALVQSFIIRADVAPVEALRTGDDASVCGQCPHRPLLVALMARIGINVPPCYVRVWQSVRSVYAAYKRGRYVRVRDRATLADALRGKTLRLGTYGDPAAAPVELWAELCAMTDGGHRGYTHQWQEPWFDHAAWAPFVMASADSIDQAALANLYGMRVFRVSVGVDRQPMETVCPASAEGNRRSNCAKCGLCAGTSVQARDIVIADHASGHAARARRFIPLAVAA